MVIYMERGANDLHMIQLMLLLPHHLCFSKIQKGLSFWYQPTQVVMEKRSVKLTVTVAVIVAVVLVLSIVMLASESQQKGCNVSFFMSPVVDE